MNEEATVAKALLTGLVAAGTALWGWFGWLVLIWIACMVLDYLSGSAAAAKKGEWNSPRAREGLWHKAGMILAVIVAALGDVVIGIILRGTGLQLPIHYTVLLSVVVVAWYTLTELGSIAENAVQMGANVPLWLRRLLKVSADAVEQAGEQMTGSDKNEDKKEADHHGDGEAAS